MEITEFVDKIEDLVYQLTPDIDSLEEIMISISDELRRRYATTAPNTEYIQCDHVWIRSIYGIEKCCRCGAER